MGDGDLATCEFVCVRGVSGHFGRHLDLLIPSTNCNTRTAPAVVSPSTSPSPPAPSNNSDRPPEPPRPSASSSSSSSSSSALLQRLPLWHLPRTPTLHKILAPQQTPTRPPSTSVVRTWSTHVLIATAPSPYTSAWSLTCESIAQTSANHYLERQPTPAAFASTVHTAIAHSASAWAYSARCVSTRTEVDADLTHPPHPAHLPFSASPSLRRPVHPPPPPPPPP
nr:unnamed protein product [Spirometra erinaceieuropaei]